MDRSKREFQVGLTVVVAILGLIIGMMWLKQVRMGGGAEIYSADFPQVSGLQVGDRVQVRGIRMGSVTAFAMMDDFVRVTFTVEQGADLREDAVIKLGTKGIVGEVLMDVDPGSGRPVEEGHIFAGVPAVSLESMTESVGEAVGSFRDLTATLDAIIADIYANARIVETVNGLNASFAHLDTLLLETRDGIRTIIDHSAAIAGAVRVATEDSVLAKTIRGIHHTVVSADSVLQHLDETTLVLQSILARVDAGEGSVGKLLVDESLYVHADSTFISLKRLADELRRNPKKYFKLSVMDF